MEKKFDSFRALKSVSLDISKGDILAIIGHNGSGKTTLMRIMATLDLPTSGEYRYKKREVKDLYELNRKVTLVFQKTTMFSSTVEDNIAYGLKVRGISDEKRERKVRKALELVKMTEHAEKKAKKLSGGEQQRVAMARALVTDPELLLLDEPTSNIDPGNAKIVENSIREISKKNGTTVVFATHSLFQAKRLSEKTAHLFDGRILEKGKTEQVFENPKDERTKKFLSGKLIT
ncbi:MAG: phosphate ABC transporter ATP-binding protein [Candidatus Hadarchaeia archaeon]